jgi:multidrug efflux pump subunit AcrA (membrane-fusion protein)
VRETGEGDQAKKTVEQVFVQAGRRSLGLVEIVSGLEAGDVVELISFTAPRGSNNGNGGNNQFKVPAGGFGGTVPGGGQGPVVIQGK